MMPIERRFFCEKKEGKKGKGQGRGNRWSMEVSSRRPTSTAPYLLSYAQGGEEKKEGGGKGYGEEGRIEDCGRKRGKGKERKRKEGEGEEKNKRG